MSNSGFFPNWPAGLNAISFPPGYGSASGFGQEQSMDSTLSASTPSAQLPLVEFDFASQQQAQKPRNMGYGGGNPPRSSHTQVGGRLPANSCQNLDCFGDEGSHHTRGCPGGVRSSGAHKGTIGACGFCGYNEHKSEDCFRLANYLSYKQWFSGLVEVLGTGRIGLPALAMSGSMEALLLEHFKGFRPWLSVEQALALQPGNCRAHQATIVLQENISVGVTSENFGRVRDTLLSQFTGLKFDFVVSDLPVGLASIPQQMGSSAGTPGYVPPHLRASAMQDGLGRSLYRQAAGTDRPARQGAQSWTGSWWLNPMVYSGAWMDEGGEMEAVAGGRSAAKS